MAIELGTGYVSLTASAKGLSQSISKELSGPLEDEGRRAGDRAGQGFSGAFGNSLKSLAVVAGSAFAAIGVGSFLKDTVKVATDFGEQLSKTNTVFKDQAGEIRDWAKTAAKGFGQSERSALTAASSFGNMFLQLGFTGRQATTMSKQMVELASDFASFHNADITDVLEAQSAAFRGEYDSVQRFVPTITAATVEAKAMALGLAGSTKELTAQDKALATQALLLEGAGDAMGDFDRTSQSLANQQRILGALWDDAKVQLGTALLPAVTAVVRFLVSAGIPAFLGLADAVSTGVGAVAEGVRIISDIISTGGTEDELQSGWRGVFERIGLAALDAVNLIRDNWPPLSAAAQDVALQIQSVATAAWNSRDAIAAVVIPLGTFATLLVTIAKVNTGIGALNTALSGLGPLIATKLGPLLAAAGPWGILAAAIVAVAVAAFFAYKKFKPFRDVVDTVGRAIRDVAVPAFEWLRDILPVVGGAITTAFDAVRGAVDTVVGAFQRFFAFLSTVFNTVVTALTPLAQWFQANVVSTINAGLELIAAVFQRVFQLISFSFSTLVAFAEPVVTALITLFNVMATQISAALEIVAIIVRTQIDFWVSVFTTFVGIMGPLWSGLWDYIKIIVETAFGLVKNTIETVLGIIRGLFQIVTGLISGDWDKFWEGIRTVAESVWNGVKGFIDTTWNAIKDIFTNAVGAVKDTVTNGFREVTDFFEDVPSKIENAVGDLSSVLVEAGKDVVRGLIRGVKSMVGELTSALGEITRLIPISKGPPERDAVLLYENGQLIMRGLMAGIDSQVPGLKRQLGDLTGGVSGFAGQVSLVGAGVGAGGVNQTIIFNQPVNARSASEELAWAMRTGRA